MAKRARRRRGGAKRAKRGTPLSVHPRYGGNSYDCRGQRVRNARGGGTHARVFCSKQQK